MMTLVRFRSENIVTFVLTTTVNQYQNHVCFADSM